MQSKGKRNLDTASSLTNSAVFLRRQTLSGISNVSVTNDNLSSSTSNVVLGALGTVLGGIIHTSFFEASYCKGESFYVYVRRRTNEFDLLRYRIGHRGIFGGNSKHNFARID